MENSNNIKNSQTTKWDSVKYLSEKIISASRKIGYCKNKIKTEEPYLGDRNADLEAAETELKEAKETLKALTNKQ